MRTGLSRANQRSRTVGTVARFSCKDKKLGSAGSQFDMVESLSAWTAAAQQEVHCPKAVGSRWRRPSGVKPRARTAVVRIWGKEITQCAPRRVADWRNAFGTGC